MKLKRKIIIAGHSIDLILLSLTLKLAIILFSLGVWQLFRLDEKNKLIARVEANLNLPPRALGEIKQDELLYAKVSLEGKFLESENIYLYGRKSAMKEKDGYYLLSPFETTHNKIIMVARGWFSHSNKEQLAELIAGHREQVQTISGIILPGESRKFMVPENDLEKKIWFTLDLDEASSVLGRVIENFYLLKLGAPEFPILSPISEKSILKIRNDHLEYAITWFCLSFALIVIFVIYSYNSNKKPE